jgi:phospholipid/cholesterol/gamma-HCH transport system substrate-binding protein
VIEKRSRRTALAVTLVGLLIAGLTLLYSPGNRSARTTVTAYFANSNGIYPGDQVRILGVGVGKIVSIEPQPDRSKITFWIDGRYRVPAEAKAVILSPSVVSARAIQLTPVYTDGPVLPDNAVIPLNRTVVPVEWDDLRTQLDRLNKALQPSRPGGLSTTGQFVESLAGNLRGQGAPIRESLIRLSQSLSLLGEQSPDLFGTISNLSVLVSALHDSSGLLRALNENLAAVTATLSNNPGEVSQAVADLNVAVTDVKGFVAENRDTLGTATDKLSQIAAALNASSDDLKQALHVFPTTLVNYTNIYQPAAGAITGALAGTNFSNPINFLCGAIQAASRLNAEHSAKLCAQYLAPIVKNRQYNFLGPIGLNPLVGTQARPNEITYSEDWLRPDYVPPPDSAPLHGQSVQPANDVVGSGAQPANTVGAQPATPVDPSGGLSGLMVPGGGGS